MMPFLPVLIFAGALLGATWRLHLAPAVALAYLLASVVCFAAYARDKAAARVGAASEARAQKVDAKVDATTRQVRNAAPSYNPVRIAGQVAQVAVRTAFSVTGAVFSTGGHVLQFAAKKVTGRG